MEPRSPLPEDLLDWSGRLSEEARLRQANAAFRLFLALHRPYERPEVKGFDSVEELERRSPLDAAAR
jgi:hypothetical protein